MLGNKSQIKSCTENCESCIHYGYCLIFWGSECKRQGGHRIPRLNTTPQEAIKKKMVEKNYDMKRKQTFDLSEPIRTRRAAWDNSCYCS